MSRILISYRLRSLRAWVRTIVVRSFSIAGTVALVGLLLLLPVALLTALVADQQTKIAGELPYTTVSGDNPDNRVLAITVKGEIDGEPADPANPVPGVAYGYDIAAQLAKAAKDDSVKAVVLVVDSPGGTIYGARAIAEAVDKYRADTKRPIITQVAGAADSGAYWVAASTDAIWSDYGTDIGSIGVISGPFHYYDKVTSVNDPVDGQVTAGTISSYNITAGAGKDEGDPYRQLTPAERANVQKGVDNDYAAFVNFVAGRRKLAAPVIRTQIGAYSYDPVTALGLKLIDNIAGRNATFDEAARRAGLKLDDYEVVTVPPSGSATPTPGAGTSIGPGAAACRALRLAIKPGLICSK